jgi:hypothetical protein
MQFGHYWAQIIVEFFDGALRLIYAEGGTLLYNRLGLN